MRPVKLDKTECGVDFLMKVGSPKDLVGDMSDKTPFRSDLFEVFFFRKRELDVRHAMAFAQEIG